MNHHRTTYSEKDTGDYLGYGRATLHRLVALGWLTASPNPHRAGCLRYDIAPVQRLLDRRYAVGLAIPEGWLTVEQAAQRLYCSEATVRRQAARGRIAVVRLSRATAFRETDVSRLVDDWPLRGLSASRARDIYRRCWAGERTRAVACEFGVNESTVQNIKHGHTWAWATGHRRRRVAA